MENCFIFLFSASKFLVTILLLQGEGIFNHSKGLGLIFEHFKVLTTFPGLNYNYVNLLYLLYNYNNCFAFIISTVQRGLEKFVYTVC